MSGILTFNSIGTPDGFSVAMLAAIGFSFELNQPDIEPIHSLPWSPAPVA